MIPYYGQIFPTLTPDQLFSTCGSQPLWGSWPFYRVVYQISCIWDIYLMILNSNNITVKMKEQKDFIVGVTTTWRTVLKGNSIRKVENLWLKGQGFSLMLGFFISWVIFVNERCQTFGEGRYAHPSVPPKSWSRTFPGPTMPFPSHWWILRSGGNQSVSWFSGDLGILSVLYLNLYVDFTWFMRYVQYMSAIVYVCTIFFSCVYNHSSFLRKLMAIWVLSLTDPLWSGHSSCVLSFVDTLHRF